MYPKEEKDVDDHHRMEGYDHHVIDEQENCKSTGFDALGTTMMTSTDDQRGIWEIDVRAQQQNLLHEMNDPSMFYNDQFPQIPDFPCMSSSSSSSSNPAPAKPISSATTTSSASSASASSSTSSAASWAVLKSEYVTEEEDDQLEELGVDRRKRCHRSEEMPAAVMSTAVVEAVGRPLEMADGSGSIDCMDVMENFGYMDLIDGNEIWDPSSIFEQNPPENLQQECLNNSNGSEVVQDGGGVGGGGRLDELGAVFFEWLKSNKEFISAEDMRNIKLKKSTVECASKRLGSSKEGKKQLLKLILEWVQQHQLQRKASGGVEGPAPATAPTPTAAATTTQYPLQHFQGLPSQPPPPTTPPPFHCNSWVQPNDMNHGFSPTPWIPPPLPYPPYMADQATNGMAMVAAQPSGTFSYMGGGDYNSAMNCHLNPYNNPGSGEYQVLESAPSWNPSQITMAAASPYNNQFPDVGNNYGPPIMPLPSAYTDQYPYNPVFAGGGGGGGEQRLMRLGSSATKEARKKRMARQRRTYFHHHHHSRQNQQHNHPNQVANSDHHPHTMLVDDNCSGKSQGGNWLYWPSTPSATTPAATVLPPPMEAPQRPPSRIPQTSDRQSKQTSSDKRQGLKTEKNLKFLLQKVLKQSDVGSLGRIVLPKKEAESHLPDLDSRDGISIAMEDIGTSQVWNMRYRFWPNNKSRMYLLENTGDFVKANGLQEGDFIVLYSDVKCGKYLIRGVKVRQPATGKPEAKKPAKRSYRSTSQSARSSPSSPTKITAI
ncbi:B3 domain-containing transcription factor ABI3 isoform X2 [Cynara cardunculus var. scolymus]|uniref:B3 domain-containing transcription factor ABI3 isoform X2 n=1 Tax=Cynara cardunculus var. scolymus TaxID=59895 RepID=UPI000D628F21|nr:B3 domain-containing transcription factor ABI3 isoform X2 [Cynara cardunculus var. scolymus]